MLGELIKVRGAKRKGWVSRRSNKGRLHGRYCVQVSLKKAPKSAVRGVKLAPLQFHGCFVSKAHAVRRAHALMKKVHLKGEPRR